MERLDLDQLHTFVTIAESGSLSSAAEVLFRSQSAISEKLQKLETACNLRLITRGKRGAKLTPAGDRLLSHARELLRLSDIAIADVRGIDLTGELRLGITDYFLPSAIAPLLQRIGNAYPGLRLKVSVESSSKLAEKHLNNEYDVTLYLRLTDEAVLPADAGVSEVLKKERLYWAANSNATFSDSQPLPLVTLPEGCRLQHYAIQQLRDKGTPYSLLHSASSVAGLQSALQAGLGIGCLNESSIPEGVKPIRETPQLPALADVEFCIFYHRGRRDIARELLEMFRLEMHKAEG